VKVDFFTPPSSRIRFERNLNLLAEAYNHGRFDVASGLSRTFDSLRRVRYLPNHRIDLLTVDESTRLSANMMTRLLDHESAPVEHPLPNDDAPNDNLDADEMNEAEGGDQ
jgi:hypothetical protein